MLGDCRVIDLGQISWADTELFMAKLRKPFASGSNVATDPSQLEVRNAKWQARLVHFLNYLFRLSDKRGSDADVKALLEQ